MPDGDNGWALEVEDLTVAYADKPVLWDIDLQVPQGVKMAIIGPNGAGKSTLVKAAMGLVKPVAGEVREPSRTIPRAMLLSLGIALAIYLPLLLIISTVGSQAGLRMCRNARPFRGTSRPT